MYYLIIIRKYNNNCHIKFKNFEQLKLETIARLNGVGWSNKYKVDLRSARSCLDYLLEGHDVVKIEITKNFDKYLEF